MKRKGDSAENDSMKLRSGKMLTPPAPLSEEAKLDKLIKRVEFMLQYYKAVTSDNPKHARELLDIISEANNAGFGYIITSKIEKAYDDNNEKTLSLKGVAGRFLGLLVFEYPQYHDVLEAKMKNFDLETPLTGEAEE